MSVLSLLVTGGAFADDPSAELKRFQGPWVVTELVEDGKVIPPQAIKEWLPSGGRAEIADNAIIFTSPHDGKKYVKVFSIDPTKYPKRIDVSTPERKDGWGIYQFDQGRLVICLADPDAAPRPNEFAAGTDSKRLMMVLRQPETSKPATQTPAKPAKTVPASTPGTAARVLTDDDVKAGLVGTWKYQDRIGALFVSFNTDGTFSTTRTVQELRLFQQVFVHTPVSSGTWRVENGQLAFSVSSSTDLARLNKTFAFTVRSLSDRDFIFVDYLGMVGSAVKVAPR